MREGGERERERGERERGVREREGCEREGGRMRGRGVKEEKNGNLHMEWRSKINPNIQKQIE